MCHLFAWHVQKHVERGGLSLKRVIADLLGWFAYMFAGTRHLLWTYSSTQSRAPQNEMVLHPNEIKKESSAITACRKNNKWTSHSYRHTWILGSWDFPRITAFTEEMWWNQIYFLAIVLRGIKLARHTCRSQSYIRSWNHATSARMAGTSVVCMLLAPWSSKTRKSRNQPWEDSAQVL